MDDYYIAAFDPHGPIKDADDLTSEDYENLLLDGEPGSHNKMEDVVVDDTQEGEDQ